MTSVAISKHMVSGGEFLITETKPNSIFTRDDLEEIQYQIASAIKEFFEKEVIPRTDEIEALNANTMHELMQKAGEVGMRASRDQRHLIAGRQRRRTVFPCRNSVFCKVQAMS